MTATATASAIKPPIGIVPRYIWIAQRIEDLNNAIQRYQNANLEYPAAWKSELDSLMVSFGTAENRDELLASVAQLPLADDLVLNPYGLKLRIGATCDTLDEAQKRATEFFTCVLAAVGKDREGRKYLRPINSRDNTIFSYIVIVCEF